MIGAGTGDGTIGPITDRKIGKITGKITGRIVEMIAEMITEMITEATGEVMGSKTEDPTKNKAINKVIVKTPAKITGPEAATPLPVTAMTNKTIEIEIEITKAPRIGQR